MKNLLKIGALTVALFAAMLVVNSTKAQQADGQLSLEITSATGGCVYATSLDLQSKEASYSALTFSGDFAGAFSCEDMNGTDNDWVLSMQADTLVNSSNPAYTISSGSILMKNTAAHVTNGTCKIYTGTLTLSPINEPKTILGKNNDLGAICEVQADTVSLEVTTAANQAVGLYTGTITINYPTGI